MHFHPLLLCALLVIREWRSELPPLLPSLGQMHLNEDTSQSVLQAEQAKLPQLFFIGFSL